MLSIKNLSVKYENNLALNDLSLEIKPNCITGLIGPNGAGKSTLLKTCIGLISSYSGAIFYNEKDLQKNRFWVKQNAVYAPENAELLPYLTGFEFLMLIKEIYKIEEQNDRILFFLDLLNLTAKKDELVSDYSHGMRQKLSVAAALLPDPDFIFLDESLNGMDAVSLANIFNFLQNQGDEGKVIIISSHNVGLIQDWCDEVYVLHNGKNDSLFQQDDIKRFRNDSKIF